MENEKTGEQKKSKLKIKSKEEKKGKTLRIEFGQVARLYLSPGTMNFFMDNAAQD